MKTTLPLFLGESKEEDAYFFLALYNGTTQFVKYSNPKGIPFWCCSVSLPDFLDLGEVPESVLNDVINFVGGPVEVTTLVTTRKRSKRDPAVISTQSEVHGDSNVITDIPRQASTRQREKTIRESSSSQGSSSVSRECSDHGSNLSLQEAFGTKDSSTTTKESDRSKEQEGVGSRFETGSANECGSMGRLPGSGGRGVGLPDASREPVARRESVDRVLDSSGNGFERVHELAADVGSSDSGLDGTSGERELLKPKRKRRTKLEMEAARALELLEAGAEKL